jgi:acetylornithine deacetylase/succinyl-diaminopimelate desuccinylase-like protein
MRALLLLICFCGALFGQSPDYDAMGREASDLLSQYLQVNTINPPGNETAGAMWLKQVLERNGIAAQLIEQEPGRSNLIARVKGNGSKRPLILLNHIDVVPATDSLWKHPPLSGLRQDGQIWGRGALDMKSTAILQLVTLIALQRSHAPLSRDIIFLTNIGEEVDSAGARFIVEKHPELVNGAEFLLNEGGANMQVDADGKFLLAGFGVGEKAPFWLRLTAHGTPGHASIPTQSNPSLRLVRTLAKVDAWQQPEKMTPVASDYLGALRATMEAAGAKGGMARFENLSFALTHNTVSITVLTGSNKTNVIPPLASAELDVRLLPGEDREAFEAALRKVINDPQVEITRLSPPRGANSSPADGEPLRVARDVLHHLKPQARTTTFLSAGYTDSYYYRTIGIASYGISPFFTTAEESSGVHGNNEHVSEKAMRFGAEYYYKVVAELVK